MKKILSLALCALICVSCSQGSKSPIQKSHPICEGFALICQHSGTCGEAYVSAGNYRDTCTCPAAYEGALCETPCRDKFIGRYVGIMSQQYPGMTTAYTHPDTVTIIANADETKATVQHLYVFMTSSPYVPAHYDTIVCQGRYQFLESSGIMPIYFTDAANNQLYFQGPGVNAFGELAYSWFNGTRQ